MLKKFAIFASIVALCTMFALTYITARYVDQKEVLRAQTELQSLKQERADLQQKVTNLTQQQQALNAEIEKKNALIKDNQEKIAQLETERSSNQMAVRKLRTEDQLENKFMQTYPQVANAANVGITQISDAKTSIKLSYLVVPAWFAETFIIEHQSNESRGKEIAEYQQNEKLYGNVIDLKNKVLSLEEEKSAAYQKGYETAYARYEDINQKYIDLLKTPPKVEFKAPAKLAMLGCSALGIAVGASL